MVGRNRKLLGIGGAAVQTGAMDRPSIGRAVDLAHGSPEADARLRHAGR
jgi:hypothetical protein